MIYLELFCLNYLKTQKTKINHIKFLQILEFTHCTILMFTVKNNIHDLKITLNSAFISVFRVRGWQR